MYVQGEYIRIYLLNFSGIAYTDKLGASVADDTTDSKRTLNRQPKCQRFAKLKELFFQRTCRHKNTTFNFAPPHPRLLSVISKKTGDFYIANTKWQDAMPTIKGALVY